MPQYSKNQKSNLSEKGEKTGCLEVDNTNEE
jgi:hypothetical protein